MSFPVTLDTVSLVPSWVHPDKGQISSQKMARLRVCGFQVPLFQRGGSVVCRWVGRGSCTADFQQLPLSITVALSAQVRIGSSRLLCQLKEAEPSLVQTKRSSQNSKCL